MMERSVGGTMYEIFVNYRRSQVTAVAQLVERLRLHFGQDKVFLDLRMRPGTRYPDELRKRVVACHVLVVMIHPGWLAEFATPRAPDWVELEIDTALRHGKPVIPILFEDTPMPTRSELPAAIADLATRNAARLRASHLAPDRDLLIRRLEEHVDPEETPPGSSFETPPARTARRLAGWAAAFFVVPLIGLYLEAPAGRLFEIAALGSALLLVLFSLGSIVVSPPLRRLDARTQRRTGALSPREFMARTWLLPAIVAIGGAYAISTSVAKDDGWQEWEVWYVIALATTGTYFMHRWWRKTELDDRAWPPRVTTEPPVFLRAAHRLHERLTKDVSWRFPRPLAVQRQAVSVYLDLAMARVALERQRRATLRDWLTGGYVKESAFFLGWLVSVLVLAAIAGAVGADNLLALTMTAAVACLATAAKVVAARRGDRRDTAWKIEELTAWQHKLGPLIFCVDEQ